MEIIHVKGNTYCIQAAESIPFYRLNDREIVLLDSGYEKYDRDGLTALLDGAGYRVRGIIGSHTHIDHGGNHMFFKERDGAVIALSMAEAAIGASPVMLKAVYSTWSVGGAAEAFRSILVTPDIVIPEGAGEIGLCGARFGILPLPGHSPGHIGIATPDGVLYVGDALMGERLLENAKLPTALSIEDDLRAKKKLYDVRYDKYILAHEGVYDDITGLIGRNIHKMEERAEAVLALLDRPRTMDGITRAAWTSFGMRSRRMFAVLVFERNVRSFVEFLQDRGDVEVTVDSGVRRYAKAGIAGTGKQEGESDAADEM